MPSNFECVGFRVDTAEALADLIQRVLGSSELIGTGPRGAETYRWQDESGARLLIEMRKGVVHNVLPSFASEPGAMLTNVIRLNDDTSRADVVDDAGEQITALAVDLEQRALISGPRIRGSASLLGMVGEISVHADAAAFIASDASLLDDSGGPPEEPPAHLIGQGLKWPPRMGEESFVSIGLFAPAKEARPIARLNGVVLDAEERVNALSGQAFTHTRVRTAGFEVDLCAPVSALSGLPQKGQVIASYVYMVGSLADWTVVDESSTGVRSKVMGLFGRRPSI